MGRYSRKQSFHGCRFVDKYLKANYQNPNEVVVFNFLDIGGDYVSYLLFKGKIYAVGPLKIDNYTDF